jgi:hypothetical protein
MKITLIAAIVMLALFSCSKEENFKMPFDENTIAKRLKFVDVNTRIEEKLTSKTKLEVIIVEWDEWGRASRNCGGWGLCNADWFPSSSKKTLTKRMNNKGSAALLEFDSTENKYYIDILLAETVPTDIPKDAVTFKIDLDFEMNVQQAVGCNLTFHKGNYFFNDSLGKFGGYRIYLN